MAIKIIKKGGSNPPAPEGAEILKKEDPQSPKNGGAAVAPPDSKIAGVDGIKIIKAGSKDAPELPEAPEPGRVGYKNPPKHTQFKKGQSGNPEGRPIRRKPPPTTIQDYLVKAFMTPVSMVVAGKQKSVPALEAVILKKLEKALRGNRLAAKDLMNAFGDRALPVEEKKRRGYRPAGEMIEELLHRLERDRKKRGEPPDEAGD